MCIFRLTAAAARQGFDRGLDLDGVLALLRRLAGDTLPPALVARLRGWWAAYGRLRFYSGVTLLSFHDDFTLAELLASTGLSNYLLYQFSPRLVAVANTEVDKLIGELQRAGHMPRVIDEARPRRGGGLRWPRRQTNQRPAQRLCGRRHPADGRDARR